MPKDAGTREKAALAATVAESVRVIHFPELANKQDVSDWFALGHSFEDLIREWKARRHGRARRPQCQNSTPGSSKSLPVLNRSCPYHSATAF